MRVDANREWTNLSTCYNHLSGIETRKNHLDSSGTVGQEKATTAGGAMAA
jgi:hypothetical protein